MAIDTQHAPSRRALLAGALGGLAAAVAAALGRPGAASAAAGSTLIIGSETNNAGSANTQLLTNSNVVAFKLLQNGPGTALMGYVTPASGETRGVYGRTDSPNGYGVQGRSAGLQGSGAAVQAIGVNNTGLDVSTDNPNRDALDAVHNGGGTAIYGASDSGYGVFGSSYSGYGVTGSASAGVGVAGLSGGSTGVSGQSTTGEGVSGTSSSSNGVFGESTSGRGVYGLSSSGPGVYGFSTNDFAGYFEGRVKITQFIEMTEVPGQPISPATNNARLFLRDNGSGKTQLCILFPTGTNQVISTEP